MIVHGSVPRWGHRQCVCLLFCLLGKELGSEYLVFGIQSLLFIFDPSQVLRHLIELLFGLLVVHLRPKLRIFTTLDLVLTFHHLARK